MGEGAAGVVCEFGEERLGFGFGKGSHFGDGEVTGGVFFSKRAWWFFVCCTLRSHVRYDDVSQ